MNNPITIQMLIEAIDLLRQRKARPDLRRISACLVRKYGVEASDVQSALDEFTKVGLVRRVDFKGSISYRNPAKVTRPRVGSGRLWRLGGVLKHPFEVALDESLGEASYTLANGSKSDENKRLWDRAKKADNKKIPPLTLKKIQDSNSKHSNTDSSEEYLSDGQFDEGDDDDEMEVGENEMKLTDVPDVKKEESENEKEDNMDTLEKNSIEEYSYKEILKSEENTNDERAVGDGIEIKEEIITNEKKDRFEDIDRGETEDDDDVKEREEPPKKKRRRRRRMLQTSPVRESRRKRIQKEIFDPSPDPLNTKSYQTHVISKREVSTSSSNHKNANSEDIDEDHCVICKKEVKVHGIKCQQCDTYAHKTCINDRSKWECDNCKKRCVVCENGPSHLPSMEFISCGSCQDEYHMKCARIRKSTTSWFCPKCSLPNPSESGSSIGSSSNRNTPEKATEKRKLSIDDTFTRKEPTQVSDEDEEEVPDCSKWTTEQVYNYFLAFVSSQDAEVFRKENINGRALLVLKRSDVIKTFKLKLGPALKIYSHVKKLQDRKFDPTLTWF